MSAKKLSEAHHVVVIVDGPDPDNFACALAATSRVLDLDVAAIIMTGRPVSAAQTAKPYEFNPAASKAVRRDNALHMKGLLSRHGREDVPVFEGLRAPYTAIPHGMHIHERVTDVEDDAHAGHYLSGGFDEAVAYLGGLKGKLHLICGGPLTDAAQLMKEPMVSSKLGVMTAQLGMFGGNNITAMAGGRRQFNVLADPAAARAILAEYPAPVCLIPTDVTKHAEHSFVDPDDIGALSESSGFDELIRMYRQAWPVMWGPRGEKIYVHDFHPAELMGEIHKNGYQFDPGKENLELGRYGMTPVTIAHVPHSPAEIERWGEIDLADVASAEEPPRFLATSVNTASHRQALAAILNSGPNVSTKDLTAYAGQEIPAQEGKIASESR
jgi:inosine-uridine nucleoside N-ribohydrolase